MQPRSVLVAISAAQFAAGVAGQVVALRDGRAFDIAFVEWRGQRKRVARDSWLLGTGLSAPVVILTIQAVATTRLAAGPSQWATRTLGVLGGAMAGGYLIEREFREALSPGGWDLVITPIAGTGFVLALAMAALGLAQDAPFLASTKR